MSAAEFFVTPGYGERLLRELHYSQAVRVGDRVETSGQGGWDDDRNFPEDLVAEIVQACDNIERTLSTAGASWRNVIQVNSYHVSIPGESLSEIHIPTMSQEFAKRTGDRAPIWTAIGVPELGNPAMRVEVRVTAIID